MALLAQFTDGVIAVSRTDSATQYSDECCMTSARPLFQVRAPRLLPEVEARNETATPYAPGVIVPDEVDVIPEPVAALCDDPSSREPSSDLYARSDVAQDTFDPVPGNEFTEPLPRRM